MSELEKKLREFISNNSLSLSFTEQLSAIRNHFDGDNYSELQNFALNYSKSLSNDDPKKYESSCLARIFMSLNMASVQASLNDAFGDIPMVDTLALMDADKKSFYSMALGYFIKANDNASVLECQKNALDDGLSKEEVETILSNNGYGQKKNDLESAMNTLFTGMGMRPEDAAEMFAQFSDFLKQKNNSPRQNQRGVRPQVNKSNKSTLRSTDSNGFEFKNIVDGIMKANLKNTIDEELEMIMLFTEDFEGLHAYIVNKYINEMLKDEKSFTGLKVLAVLSALDGNEDKYYNNLLAYHLKACQRAYKDCDYDFVYAREKLISTLVEQCKQNNISDDEIKKIFEHYSFSEEFGSLSIDDIISGKVLEENEETKNKGKHIFKNVKDKFKKRSEDKNTRDDSKDRSRDKNDADKSKDNVEGTLEDRITSFLKNVPIVDNYDEAKKRYSEYFSGYKLIFSDFEEYALDKHSFSDDLIKYKFEMLKEALFDFEIDFYFSCIEYYSKARTNDNMGYVNVRVSESIRKCLDLGAPLNKFRFEDETTKRLFDVIIKEYYDRSKDTISSYCNSPKLLSLSFSDEKKFVKEFIGNKEIGLGNITAYHYFNSNDNHVPDMTDIKFDALRSIIRNDLNYGKIVLNFYKEAYTLKKIDMSQLREAVETLMLDDILDVSEIKLLLSGNSDLQDMVDELDEGMHIQSDNKLVKSIDEFFGVRKIAKKIRRKISKADASKVDEGIIRGCDNIVKSFDDVEPTPLVDEDDDKITIDQPSSLDQSGVQPEPVKPTPEPIEPSPLPWLSQEPEPVKPQTNPTDNDFLAQFAVPAVPQKPTTDDVLQQELIPETPTRQDAYRGVMNALGEPVEKSEELDHGRSL